ncbi:uncharacterized protein TNCV_3352111 [Trichonephila clavipes]|nr:uncharacterized protein TNCV_3352111 [Trichonephila clavipes]
MLISPLSRRSPWSSGQRYSPPMLCIGEEITDLVQSIQGFHECDQEDVEDWMACDAEVCGFQMLNGDEIVTSVQEESDNVNDETDGQQQQGK